MLEVADVFRLHGTAYRARFGDRLLPSQKRAVRDIEACRTAFFGGHLKQCDRCGHQVYTYHSCGNRHCPKCHRDQTERWIEKQRARLLPCFYFLLTFTLPSELRPLARAHQKKVYGLLMSCAAAALFKLTRDPRYLGARPGCLAVLHTWTRAMLYHPHVHLLVTAGGLSADGTQWIHSIHPHYLVPVKALSVIFRAKICAALKKAKLLDPSPRELWKKDWVVHCQPAGSGEKVLDYLGRYVFRIAIAKSRLEQFDNGQVTFRYRDNHSQELHRVTLPAEEFIHRFLQHVLPRGCTKVRYYGIWSSSCRQQLEQARALLDAPPARVCDPAPALTEHALPTPAPARCPHCRIGRLIVIEVLLPQRRFPP
ncbi:MAG: IS91 family transposase [Acidobacteria bacterium]|nr:IS91 family transposase [Acidobacteriota bacterium]